MHCHLSRQPITICKQICDKVTTTFSIIPNPEPKQWLASLGYLKSTSSVTLDFFPFFSLLLMKY